MPAPFRADHLDRDVSDPSAHRPLYPILGQLFHSQLFQHNETELVIIVTPYFRAAFADPPHGADRRLRHAAFDAQRFAHPGKKPQPAGGERV